MRQVTEGKRGTGKAYTQDGEEDVDEEIGTASTLEENSERREDDGNDDLADVAGEQSRC